MKRSSIQPCSIASMSFLLLALALGAIRPVRAEDGALLPPPPPNNKITQAVALLNKGQLKQADAMFQKVTDGEPGYLDAELGRAQIAITGQQLDAADRMVTAVLKRQDTLPEAHNMKGLVLLLRKNNDGARREFSRAIELQPLYVTPRLYLAVMDRVSGNYAGAVTEYKALTGVAPQLPAGYLGQAEARMLQGRQPDAIKVLEGWKAADPKTVLPYQVLANIYLVDHKPQDAQRQLQAALARSPHDSQTLTILGTAYSDAGDVRSAMNQYQAALAANPKNGDAALRLGDLEARSGQPDKALVHYRAALQVDPNNAVVCNNIAYLLADQGKNLDEALRLAQLAVKRSPKYADAYDTLGWVRYRRNEYPAAVAALQQAKVLAPSNPDVAAHLGLALAQAGHKTEGLAELRRALAPGNQVSNRADLERTAAQLASTTHP